MSQEFRHCDEYIEDDSQPLCLRRFLRYKRWPAIYQVKALRLGIPCPPLFADFPKRHKPGKFHRVRVVMASRFGDVGITRDLNVSSSYEWRVSVECLSNFSEIKKKERR